MDGLPRIAVVTVIIAVSWCCFALKVRHSRRVPQDKAVRAMCVVLAGVALCMTAQFAAARLDEAVSVPGVGRLLGNCAAMLAAFGVALYLVHVTAGPAQDVAARRHVSLLTLALALVVGLFAITPAQPEASLGIDARDVHVIYVSPYAYVYLSYLAVIIVGSLPRVWRLLGLAERRSLRSGVRLIFLSLVTGLAYCVAKAAFLTAHYAGLAADEWEYRVVSPLYLAAIVLALAGLLVPIATARGAKVADWLRAYRSYRRLLPLWRALYAAEPGIALIPPSVAQHRHVVRDLPFRLYRTAIEIRDAQLALRPYTGHWADRAKVLAQAAGLSGLHLRAAVEAAALGAALDAKAAGRRPEPASGGYGEIDDSGEFAAEIRYLETVASLFTRSPVVRSIRADIAGRFRSGDSAGERGGEPEPSSGQAEHPPRLADDRFVNHAAVVIDQDAAA